MAVFLAAVALSLSGGTHQLVGPMQNVPPTASCSAPNLAKTGETVSFDASSSRDPDRTGVWTVAAPMLGARRGLAATVVDGKLYAIGGGLRGTPLNRTEVYNPLTDGWEMRAPMPTARDVVEGAVLGGKIHVIGGINYDTFPPNGRDEHEVYDPATDTWESRAPVPERGFVGAEAFGAVIYVIIPHNGHTYAYNASSDTWSPRASFPSPAAAAQWREVGSWLIVAGGLHPTQVGDTWAYDPSTDSWTSLATMPTARVDAGYVSYEDRLYVVGGQTGGLSVVTDAFEEYDPVADTWRQLPPMSQPRDEVGAAVLDDEIYVLGGRQEPTHFALVEKYSMKLRYDWDFGDGGSGTGKMVEHAYASPGEYTVTLTVTDPLGAAGTDTCAIRVEAGTLEAEIDFDPDTLNPESRGKWVAVYIELPVGYDPRDINATTIRLNGTLPPVLDRRYGFVSDPSGYIVDHDADGISERMVKFDREEVIALLPLGTNPVRITGLLIDGTSFSGLSDPIRVLG